MGQDTQEAKPQRIQLRRTKGFNLQRVSHELNGLPAVNCARPGVWGNPWTYAEATAVIPSLGFALFSRHPKDRPLVADQLVREFRQWLVDPIDGCERHVELADRRAGVLRRLPELRGKNLACFCALIDRNGEYQQCHSDVLLSLANDIPIIEVQRENFRRATGQAV